VIEGIEGIDEDKGKGRGGDKGNWIEGIDEIDGIEGINEIDGIEGD
jgi:hypothetical protein